MPEQLQDMISGAFIILCVIGVITIIKQWFSNRDLEKALQEVLQEVHVEDYVDTLDFWEDRLEFEEIRNAAAAAHEANRVYCESTGDMSQPLWRDAPEWQQQSAYKGVLHIIENPNTTPEESHVNWLKEKTADGWVYGEVKDPDEKTHPCMVPYKDLPEHHQVKDALFIAVVRASLGFS